jgi:hypothetical protein
MAETVACGSHRRPLARSGKYAILGPSWTEQQTEASTAPTACPAGPVIPATMAVLEVLP